MEVIVPQLNYLQSLGLVAVYSLLWYILGYLVGRKGGIKDGIIRGQKQGFYDAVQHLKQDLSNVRGKGEEGSTE